MLFDLRVPAMQVQERNRQDEQGQPASAAGCPESRVSPRPGASSVQAELLEQAQGQIKGSSQGAEPADAQKKTHDMLFGRGELVG